MSPPYSPDTQSQTDPSPSTNRRLEVFEDCIGKISRIERTVDRLADPGRVSLARIEQGEEARATTALQRAQARREA